MGMPKIPEGTYRPSFDDVIIDLFESIALEEMAISHILNAEGKKFQSVVRNYKCNLIDIKDLYKVTDSSNNMIINLIFKEWLLLTKFNTIKDYALKKDNKCYNKCCDEIEDFCSSFKKRRCCKDYNADL